MNRILKLVMFCLFIFIIYYPCNVYADDTSVKLEITSGINTSKLSEATFDKTRTVTGTSENEASISINIYMRNLNGDLDLVEEYLINVGASEIFSQTINLKQGTNIIEIIAEKEGKESIIYEYKIKNKSEVIKKELETKIVLPGVS